MKPWRERLEIPEESIPSADRTKRMEAATTAARRTLAPVQARLSISPLGAGWSSDIDVHVADVNEAADLAIRAGWIPLSEILLHLGHSEAHSFAIVESGAILAKADLKLGEAPSAVEKLTNRALRAGSPDVRTLFEILELLEGGLDPKDLDPGLLRDVANLEETHGGRSLKAWRAPSPASISPGGVRRGSRLRRPTVRLAICGIDGSGKSTLASEVAESLARCEIQATAVWTRPGMRLRWLHTFAGWARRLRGEETIGLERLAEGEAASTISSRRGLVGWVWLSLVTVAYLIDVRRQTRRAGGVVVYDRHLIDALGTIEVLYQGVNSWFQRRLIRLLIPRVDLSLWLDIHPDVAAARKPDDLIGAALVEQQHAAYHRYADEVPDLQRSSGTGEQAVTAVDALRRLNEALASQSPSLRARLFRRVRRRRSR
ncbi:MAG: hypothetical protein OEX97_10015 [Acidimicrobiia bacterium]|nr:hypothetical protein [Acidimicrobiia bacterium]